MPGKRVQYLHFPIILIVTTCIARTVDPPSFTLWGRGGGGSCSRFGRSKELCHQLRRYMTEMSGGGDVLLYSGAKGSSSCSLLGCTSFPRRIGTEHNKKSPFLPAAEQPVSSSSNKANTPNFHLRLVHHHRVVVMKVWRPFLERMDILWCGLLYH